MYAGMRTGIFDYVEEIVHGHLLLVRHQKLDRVTDVRFGIEHRRISITRGCHGNGYLQVANFLPETKFSFVAHFRELRFKFHTIHF